MNPPNSSEKFRNAYEASKTVVESLKPFITENRISRIEQVLAHRTRKVVPVLDQIYDTGNINAVYRTCESLGYQDIHVVESEQYRVANRVTQGADKWLSIHRWKSQQDCIKSLRKKNFKIYSTSLSTKKTLSDIDWSTPSAIVFGNEKNGASPIFLQESDDLFQIPMTGFSQSFNISVAAAICLYHIFSKQNSNNLEGLETEEKMILRARYYLKSIKGPERYFKNKGLLSTLHLK